MEPNCLPWSGPCKVPAQARVWVRVQLSAQGWALPLELESAQGWAQLPELESAQGLTQSLELESAQRLAQAVVLELGVLGSAGV